MRLVNVGLRVWLYAALLCAAAVLVPRLQPPADTLSLLRLTECALPCWIGIVPGKTTVGEARDLVNKAYVGSDYQLAAFVPDNQYTSAYMFEISLQEQRRDLWVEFNVDTRKRQDDTSIVHQISLSSRSQNRRYDPALIDTAAVLGSPQCLSLGADYHTAWPVLIYTRWQTIVSLNTNNFSLSPELKTSLEITDEPITCHPFDIPWCGFSPFNRYRDQLLAAILP